MDRSPAELASELEKLEKKIKKGVGNGYPGSDQAWNILAGHARRFRNSCSQLLLLDTEAALKNEVDLNLWRIGVYEVFSLLRKRASQSSQDGAKARDRILQLLDEATGLYIRLYQHVSAKHGIGAPVPSAMMAVTDQQDEQASPSAVTQARTACFRWLIALGDLARYHANAIKANSKQPQSVRHVQNYYLQAFLLDPTNGTACNQLASTTMSAHVPHAAFLAQAYYMRSMLSPSPFLNVQNNMNRLCQQSKANGNTSPASVKDAIAQYTAIHILAFADPEGDAAWNYSNTCMAHPSFTSLLSQACSEATMGASLLDLGESTPMVMLTMALFTYHRACELQANMQPALLLLFDVLDMLLAATTKQDKQALAQSASLAALKVLLDYLRISMHAWANGVIVDESQRTATLTPLQLAEITYALLPDVSMLLDRLVPALDTLVGKLDMDIAQRLPADANFTQLALLPEDAWLQGYIPLQGSIQPAHDKMTTMIDVGQQRLLALLQSARFIVKHWYIQTPSGEQAKLCAVAEVDGVFRILSPEAAKALPQPSAQATLTAAPAMAVSTANDMKQTLPLAEGEATAMPDMDDHVKDEEEEEDVIEGEVTMYQQGQGLVGPTLLNEEEALTHLSATSDEVINAVLGAELMLGEWSSGGDDGGAVGDDDMDWHQQGGVLASDPWQSAQEMKRS
eukprot:TRINITY_DN11872_c0_g2_i3.p1 TRINITY_DN11872_c0_g2~~TRINITY_DN11872_c0_g2_i3.p1  ORF type:complete len:683 (+),score=193.55 TRINITY_DN11872_c0_g2_i3:200-2248(+)